MGRKNSKKKASDEMFDSPENEDQKVNQPADQPESPEPESEKDAPAAEAPEIQESPVNDEEAEKVFQKKKSDLIASIQETKTVDELEALTDQAFSVYQGRLKENGELPDEINDLAEEQYKKITSVPDGPIKAFTAPQGPQGLIWKVVSEKEREELEKAGKIVGFKPDTQEVAVYEA